MASEREAEEIVIDAALNAGYLPESVRQSLGQSKPEEFKVVEKAIGNVHKMVARALDLFAKQVYTSDSRFVFELLQNADDCDFENAKRSNQQASVHFKVYHSGVVVETNEDGFKKANVLALSSIDQSTKLLRHGYIGNKGIGFKSVFRVAEKVTVRSGHFSFYFDHREGGDGLGMVAPKWEKAPFCPGTTISLEFPRASAAEKFQNIRTDFENVNLTSILFFRKLQSVKVTIHDSSDRQLWYRSFRKEIEAPNLFRLTTDKSGSAEPGRRLYFVFKHIAENIRPSQSRQTNNKKEDIGATTVEIVLAFPLTPDSKPIVEQQQFFAFLPINFSPCTFVIHSDFDTNVSREDFQGSARNFDLIKATAAAFFCAVEQFFGQDDHAMCYEWPTYLPKDPKQITHPVWKQLVNSLRDEFSRRPLVASRHRKSLRSIADVRILKPDFVDAEGQPLLDDLDMDLFVSTKYSSSILEALRPYGLHSLRANEAVDLISRDLLSANSRIKSDAETEDWHSRLSKFLLASLHTSTWDKIKSLPIVPLRDGQWISIWKQCCYFPTAEGLEIPLGLPYSFISLKAARNSIRAQLFEMLGVDTKSVAQVRKDILFVYSAALDIPSLVPTPRLPSLEESVSQISFLYQTRRSAPPDEDLSGLRLFARQNAPGNSVLLSPSLGDIYLSALGHPYGPEGLFNPTLTAPGHSINKLDETYCARMDEIRRKNPDMALPLPKTWLQHSLRCRSLPRLISRRFKCLSEEWNYVVSSRPDRIMGLLARLWPSEGEEIKKLGLLSPIRSIRAHEINAASLLMPICLKDLFVETDQLSRYSSRFLLQHEPRPFVDLDKAKTQVSKAESWDFLFKDIGLSREPILRFFCFILRIIKLSNRGSHQVEDPKRILETYLALAKELKRSRENPNDIIFSFKSGALIYVSLPQDEGLDGFKYTWAAPEECCWNGPRVMVTRHALAQSYGDLIGTKELAPLSQFFESRLYISDAKLLDLIREIEWYSDRDSRDLDHVCDLYRYIRDNFLKDYGQQIRTEFRTKRLLLLTKGTDSDGWYTSQSVFWSTSGANEQMTLNDQFTEKHKDLQDFLLTSLGVQEMTVGVIVGLLKTADQEQPDRMLELLGSLNCAVAYDQAGTTYAGELNEVKMFPMRHGENEPEMVSLSTHFFIPDRESLADKFRDKVKILDFSLYEVLQLRPLFVWMGLAPRFITHSVRVTTSVPNAEFSLDVAEDLDLRFKAHPLLRVAATFKSRWFMNNPLDLYQALLNLKVRMSDSIIQTTELLQDGKSFDVKDEPGCLHLDPKKDTVFIPLDRAEQGFCMSSLLPEAISAWLMDYEEMISDDLQKLTSVLGKIFLNTPHALDFVLDHECIVSIEIENVDPEPSSLYPDVGESPQMSGGQTELSPVREEVPAAIPETGFDHGHLTVLTGYSEAHEKLRSRSEPLLQVSYGIPSDSDSDDEAPLAPDESSRNVTSERMPERGLSPPSLAQARRSSSIITTIEPPHEIPPDTSDAHERARFVDMLCQITARARETAFPQQARLEREETQDPLEQARQHDGFDGPQAQHLRVPFRSQSQQQRDFKVGAAGELFVHEVLYQALSQHGWNVDAWKSSIRHLIREHPDYHDISEQSQREKADFVFQDNESILTQKLIESRHLPAVPWQGRSPLYYIEVKSTTGPYDTAFFMSKSQHKRMSAIDQAIAAEGEDRDLSKIYMILRVFNLGHASIDMDIYLHSNRDRLAFTPDSWSVAPTSSSN